MMRNALRDIVPAEVLERRRKAARSRSMPLALQRQERKIETMFNRLAPPLSYLLDQSTLQLASREAIRQTDLSRMHFVVRAILVQFWIGQRDCGSTWNSRRHIGQTANFAEQSGDQALPAERLF